MNRQVREALFERCLGYCEKCGKPLGTDWAVHHRKLRSQGGRDSLDNLLALHHACHNLGTDAVHLNPAHSMERGYIVPRHAEPQMWELTLPNGNVVCLSPEGNYELIREADSDGW